MQAASTSFQWLRHSSALDRLCSIVMYTLPLKHYDDEPKPLIYKAGRMRDHYLVISNHCRRPTIDDPAHIAAHGFDSIVRHARRHSVHIVEYLQRVTALQWYKALNTG